MGRRKGPDSQSLAELARRFEEWRSQHGGRGRRLPESLWSAAVDVAKVGQAWQVAKVLRVREESLSARIRARDLEEATDAVTEPGSSDFIDVGVMPSPREIVVELTGSPVRIRLPMGSAMAEVAGLARLLAEAGR